jgi:hypothetical protein
LDLEMKRLNKDDRYYDPDSGLSKEERWERNRQIFLNLPKTPGTPGFGMKSAMTPRTTAFTQLNGGYAPPRTPRMAGPKGGLKFREQYGDVAVPDAR